MELHRGRLIDHVHLRAKDLEASKRFYAAIFDALGIPYLADDIHLQADEFWMDAGDGSRVHLAFQALDRTMVDRVYAAALAAGGRDNGKPDERPYHPGYYAGFFLDPDGNNIEAVHHGDAKRLRRQRHRQLRDAQGLILRGAHGAAILRGMSENAFEARA